MSDKSEMRAARAIMELIRDDALVIPDDGRSWSWEASTERKIAAALASVREPRPAECPPHDFGQDEDPPATLPEMIGRTCPKCEISGGEVLGMMVKLRELEPGAGEGA